MRKILTALLFLSLIACPHPPAAWAGCQPPQPTASAASGFGFWTLRMRAARGLIVFRA